MLRCCCGILLSIGVFLGQVWSSEWLKPKFHGFISQTFLKNPQTFQSVFSQIDSPLSTLQECTTLKFFGSALFGAATGAFSVAYAIGGNKGIPLEEYGIFNFGSDSATEREIFLLGFRISEKS